VTRNLLRTTSLTFLSVLNTAFTHASFEPGNEQKVDKLAQYFVCKVDRKLASYSKQEIRVLKLRKLFLQTSGFIPGRQNY